MQESPRQRVIRSIQTRIGNGSYASMMRLPSEANLAEELDVSRGTVRNALTELVESGILALKPNIGYFVPETLPVSFRKERHMVFILPEETQKPGNHYLEGLEKTASENGIDLKVVILRDDLDRLDAVVEQLRSPGYVGAILLPRQCPDFYEYNIRIIDKFSFAGINHVVIDSPVCCGGIIRGNFVGSDGYNASREIVDSLADAGHRKIGTIRIFSGVYTADARIRGIEDQLRYRGIPLVPEYHTEVEHDRLLRGQGRQRIRELMALPEPPTAIICSHDELAFNVIDELRRMKLRIPEDVSIFGFDDMEIAALIDLSTVAQPFREIGRRAAEILIENCGDARVPLRQEFLPCRLIPRGSVAALAGRGNEVEIK